jgi:hypothetical protein
LLPILWILAMSKFFFFPKTLGVKEPSFFVIFEKFKLGLWVYRLIPGVEDPAAANVA